jgi:hypothetical protein
MSSTPLFYCKDCHCSFQRKLNYEHHLTTTKHKNRISKQNKPSYLCPFCNKLFSHCSSLSRHKINCNIKNTNIHLDILQKENEELRKEIELLKTESNKPNVTNHQNNTTNIKNQTNNIIINCFGNENLDYITDKVILHCMNKIYGSIPLLIEKIHFDPEHPENHNIQIPNKKLPHAKIMNRKKEWQIVQKKDAIDSMIDNGYNILDETFQEKSHALAETKQKHFRDFQAKYEEADKDTMKDIKEKVEMLIINNSRK